MPLSLLGPRFHPAFTAVNKQIVVMSRNFFLLRRSLQFVHLFSHLGGIVLPLNFRISFSFQALYTFFVPLYLTPVPLQRVGLPPRQS